MANIDCFVIFEGGGAKGIGHLGALKALEKTGLSTLGVAGTSAGAIVAALTAVGYNADELFDPVAGTDILSQDGKTPIDLLGASDWRVFRGFGSPSRSRLASIARGFVLGLPPIVSVWLFSLTRHLGWPAACGIAWRVIDFFGFFSTENARSLLNTLIRQKLAETSADVPDLVCFRDIDPAFHPNCAPLKVIATNLTKGSPELFDSSTPDVVVADAVAASFCIPVFFKPCHVRRVDGNGDIWVSDATFADGGLVSNLPVWAFANDKRAIERLADYRDRRPIPVVAFTLDEQPKGSSKGVSPVGGLMAYILGVARTGVFGGQTIQQKFTSHLTVVNLPTELATTAFDCTRDDATKAYRAGYDAAADALNRIFRINRAARADRLSGMIELATQLSGSVRQPGITQFRACLVRRLNDLSFKVIDCVNMSADTDDDLVLDQKNPGAPTAYVDRNFSFVDVQAPDRDMMMTKYERALLRPGLKSVIAIPIFKDAGEWAKVPPLRNPPVGVFCLDSDSDLKPEYQDLAFMSGLALEAVRFANLMSFDQERS